MATPRQSSKDARVAMPHVSDVSDAGHLSILIKIVHPRGNVVSNAGGRGIGKTGSPQGICKELVSPAYAMQLNYHRPWN